MAASEIQPSVRELVLQVAPAEHAQHYLDLVAQQKAFFEDLGLRTQEKVGKPIHTVVAPAGGTNLFILRAGVKEMIISDQASLFSETKPEGQAMRSALASGEDSVLSKLPAAPYITAALNTENLGGEVYRQLFQVIGIGYDSTPHSDTFHRLLATCALMGVDIKTIHMRAYKGGYRITFPLDGIERTVYYYSDTLPMSEELSKEERNRARREIRTSLLFRHPDLHKKTVMLLVQADYYNVAFSADAFGYNAILADASRKIPADIYGKFRWELFPVQPSDYSPLVNAGYPEEIEAHYPSFMIGIPL